MLSTHLLSIPRKFSKTLSLIGRSDIVVMNWATQGLVKHNWGDKLNVWMGRRLRGGDVIHRSDIYPMPGLSVHYWIGSHLATACADNNAVIWGAGCISQAVPLAGKPKRIHAVRGWLSNRRLKEAGLDAPNIVGDAALLLPRLYQPARHLKRAALGVIPHYSEWNEEFYENARNWDGVRVIDICGDIENVIEQIVSCDRVVSSSLHGIICADAFGVPSMWLSASDKPAGDGFKFRDYFSSVQRSDRAPFVVTSATERAEVEDLFYDYRIQIDLDALWAARPDGGGD